MNISVAELRRGIRNVSAKKVNVGSVKGRNLLAEKSKDLASIKKVAKSLQALTAEANSLVKAASKMEDEDDALDAGAIAEDFFEGFFALSKIMRKLGPRLESELNDIADDFDPM